jgi:hypothetical protein
VGHSQAHTSAAVWNKEMKKKSLGENLRLVLAVAWLIYGFVVLYSVSVVKTMRSILRLLGVEF